MGRQRYEEVGRVATRIFVSSVISSLFLRTSFGAGRFTMGHKRASTLLSGVSQSIVSALSPPPSLNSPAFLTPALAAPGKSLPSPASTVSLLDDDDLADTDSTTRLGSVMKPDTPPTLKFQSTTSTLLALKAGDKMMQDDGDDEWNW
jgi:hypothetical protein